MNTDNIRIPEGVYHYTSFGKKGLQLLRDVEGYVYTTAEGWLKATVDMDDEMDEELAIKLAIQTENDIREIVVQRIQQQNNNK